MKLPYSVFMYAAWQLFLCLGVQMSFMIFAVMYNTNLSEVKKIKELYHILLKVILL